MSRAKKPSQQVPVEERLRGVLAVLSGEMSMDQARRPIVVLPLRGEMVKDIATLMQVGEHSAAG